MFNTIVRLTWPVLQRHGSFTRLPEPRFGRSVMRDAATGLDFGAFDPRKDGAALPRPMSASD
jgi:hypothetical protein